MKFFSTKNIYTDLKEEELEGVKKFSEEKKVKLRKIQLELLSYILKFCDEFNQKYMDNEFAVITGGYLIFRICLVALYNGRFVVKNIDGIVSSL